MEPKSRASGIEDEEEVLQQGESCNGQCWVIIWSVGMLTGSMCVCVCVWLRKYSCVAERGC